MFPLFIGAVLGGCLEVASSKVKSFGYLYDEQHFITAVKDDVRVVKLLPNSFRTRASLQKLPVKTPTRFSSVQFYLDEVLPALSAHGACGLVFAKGGGLQVCSVSPSIAVFSALVPCTAGDCKFQQIARLNAS